MEKNGLKKLLSSISTFRSSLSSACNGMSDAVETPNFISHHHHHHHHHPPPPLPLPVDCRSCRPTGLYRRSTPRKNKGRKTQLLLTNGYGLTSCSSGDSDDGASFSSENDETNNTKKQVEEEEEKENLLLCSKSFSSDSSEFYRKSSKKKKKKKKKKKSHNFVRQKQSGRGAAARDVGMAVEKQSSDPYGDFRTSVLEMVVVNQIVGAKELEQLLGSYLSLNSASHHPVILQVFSDVWNTLFVD